VYAEAYKQRYLIAPKYVQGEKVAGARGFTADRSTFPFHQARIPADCRLCRFNFHHSRWWYQPQTLQWRFLRGLSPQGWRPKSGSPPASLV